MDIQIVIDKSIGEDSIMFKVKEMTPEYTKLIEQLQHLPYRLIGSKGNKKYQIDYVSLLKINVIDKKIYATTDDNQNFILSETLKELSNKLPNEFLRISNSEIVNANKIASLELTFGGKIKIFLKSNQVTYSSRGYLKEIKGYFGL
ncbi:LytTR family DNA-binding domain-containing protein [Leuconostoc rapi]|uniref:LytTR family DNA-binding domain-containing protein n=1 Tax=Leuconostoc rapi TaxID=1406906 RepID=UPI00195DF031|nr:LytTR family DNA-binding domain-containing protein [Leuconostoc rapi]MBM7435357.1 DNA-binding LytR/AlgR family response regulator [Leuconostoc rapi]